MMNKTDVSNQITGLRPKVKQAAVHVAHHHTREIKKCESRKGPKATKFHNKAENLRKEVLLLKSIRPDTVSRYALMMKFEDREKLLGDVNLPLETKVIIKLATHEAVKSHIEAFRLAHPEWESKLPHLLETLGILAKHKKKIEKEKEKQKRKLARRQELAQSVKEDSCTQEETMESTIKVTRKVDQKVNAKLTSSTLRKASESEESEDINLSGSEREDNENESSEDEDGHSYETEDQDSSENEEAHSHSSSSDESSPEDKKSTHVNNEVSQVSNTKISTGSKFAEVRRFADLQKELQLEKERKLEQSAPILTNIDKSVGSDISDSELVEEDTFFVTKENQFLKTVAVKRENGEGLITTSKPTTGLVDRDSPQWVVDGRKLKGNRAQRRAKFLGKDPKKVRPKKPSQNSSDTNVFREGRKSLDFKNGDAFSKLPKGKYGEKRNKMGFDSDHSLVRREGKSKEKLFEGKNTMLQPGESKSGESLHPSWEAKRKQKVSLDNFQGKKIKFDDD